MTVGNTLEQKKIGLQIGVNGTHDNTELDETTGHLRLKVVGTDGSGKAVYAEEGTWISDTIDLQDKFTDFDKVFTSQIGSGASSLAVLTRVSDNRTEWSEWLPVALDGAIQSDTKQYIQIRIDLFAGFVTDVYLISDFNKVEDVNLFKPSQFIEASNGLRLKREHKFDMKLDSTWTGEGSLHRKKINRDDWVRIDRLNVLTVEE